MKARALHLLGRGAAIALGVLILLLLAVRPVAADGPTYPERGSYQASGDGHPQSTSGEANRPATPPSSEFL